MDMISVGLECYSLYVCLPRQKVCHWPFPADFRSLGSERGFTWDSVYLYRVSQYLPPKYQVQPIKLQVKRVPGGA